MKIIVRSHIRKNKVGKHCVVRTHSRTVRDFKKCYGIKTPIELNLKHKADQSDSLAHHAMHYDSKNKRAKKHEINVDVQKVKKSGRNVGEVVKHELNHVLDVEKIKGKMKNANDTFSKRPEGKKLLAKYRKGKNKRRSAKELFADNH